MKMFAHKDMFRSKNESEWVFLAALAHRACSDAPLHIRMNVAEKIQNFIVRGIKCFSDIELSAANCAVYKKTYTKYQTNFFKSGSLPA